MADEVTDASNREQVVICLRRVDAYFEVHEEIIGLYKVDETSVNTITQVLKDVLERINLPISSFRGQCHNGTQHEWNKTRYSNLYFGHRTPCFIQPLLWPCLKFSCGGILLNRSNC